MKVVKHTAAHVFVHVALFTAFALLIPVISSAFDGKPFWGESSAIVTASFLLIIICAFMIYRIKETLPSALQSIGGMVFLPGALNVLFSVLSFDKLFSSGEGISGMAVVAPVANFYIEHSVPSILSVAAFYMAVGGALYWTGHMIEKAQDKFSFNNQ